MSLTTRLLAFFLVGLAVVLVGFSTTLYLVASQYLGRHVDERLTAALDTLDAAVEHGREGLKWEGHERRLALGQDTEPEVVRWEVLDSTGKLLDRSSNLNKAELQPTWNSQSETADGGFAVMALEGQPWKMAWRRLRASNIPRPDVASASRKRHPALMLSAGVSLEPMHASLHGLALTLLGLSAGIWLVAALGGRWVCRKALNPVTRMAAAARSMGATDLCQRLPDPATKDELSQLHRAFNGLLDRIQEAFERQRRFTGDASHQLRTPLTAILGQVEVALRREREPEEYRQVLSLVQGRTEHLRQITEALLFLARADADAELAHLQQIDLTTWLPEHLQVWQDHARAGDLRVQCTGAISVRAQPVLLSQLLDNLLDNAFKYSEPGTPVTVVAQREGADVTLAVQDAGHGIAPGDLPHVFVAFFRSAEARRLGKAGVGLGLAVAQRIATACGGELAAASELGRGSRFTVRLPALS